MWLIKHIIIYRNRLSYYKLGLKIADIETYCIYIKNFQYTGCKQTGPTVVKMKSIPLFL